MDREAIGEKLKEIARDVANHQGLEFVHSELAGTKNNLVVRVFLDKTGGITLDECGNASRDIEGVLDTLDLIPNSYVLEVSSPGLERRLFGLDDYKKFAGETVRLKTDLEFAGRKAFKGKLTGVKGDSAIIEDPAAGTLEIPIVNIVRANLVFDFTGEFGPSKGKKAARE